MFQSRIRLTLALLVCSANVAGQLSHADPVAVRRIATRISELSTPRTRASATSELLRYGATATPTLVDALATPEGTPNLPVVAMLGELRASAISADTQLLELYEKASAVSALPLLVAIAKVAPYRRAWNQPFMDRVHRRTQALVATLDRAPDGTTLAMALRREFIALLIRVRTASNRDHQLVGTLTEGFAIQRTMVAELLGQLRYKQAANQLHVLLWRPKQARGTSQSAFGRAFVVTDDGFLAVAAAALLQIVGPRHHLSVPAHLYYLRHGTTRLRRIQAALDLGALGSESAAATKAMIEVARRCSTRLAGEIVCAFGRMGRAALPAMPGLHALTHCSDHQLRVRAPLAMRLIETDTNRKPRQRAPSAR